MKPASVYIVPGFDLEVFGWVTETMASKPGWTVSIDADGEALFFEVEFTDKRLETLFLLKWSERGYRMEEAWKTE